MLMTVVSRVRKFATEHKHNLGANYEVTSFVKPGVRLDTSVNTARN